MRIRRGDRPVRQVIARHRLPATRPEPVDRLAVGDRQQPRPHVAVGSEPGIRPQRGDERLLPVVLGVGRPDQAAQQPQHRRSVLVEHGLERREGHALINARWRRLVRDGPTLRAVHTSHAARP